MPDTVAPIFLDTAYVYALVNIRDEWHEDAVRWRQRLEAERRKLVTTDLIVIEIADGLASIRFRTQGVKVITALQSSPFVEVISLTPDLLADAIDTYGHRSDKDRGLTDCVSFVVMRERGLLECLTVDKHFQQAGFRALLREGRA